MQPLTQDKFLKKLEVEAQLQSQLNQHKILPAKLRGIGRLAVAYPWQVRLVLSGLSGLVILI